MTDSSWDNGGIAPVNKGMSTGKTIALGCGGAFVLLMVTCAVGSLAMGRMIKRDPHGFQKHVEGWAKGLVQKDWDRVKGLVDHLQTEEGARQVYQANPGLHRAYPTEALWMSTVQAWRPRLQPLPPDIPLNGTSETGFSADINKLASTSTLRCTYPGGARLTVVCEGERVSSIQVD